MGAVTRPILRVDERAFRNNIAAIAERVAPAEIMLVVKDDAYGHGARWAAETAIAAGVRWVGAYDVHTAVMLRDTVDADAELFAWATSTDAEIVEAIMSGVHLGVGTIEYLRRVIAQAVKLGSVARIHLKIDTGLHRNGLSAVEWGEGVRIALEAQDAGAVDLVGVWSHLSEASDEEDDASHVRFLAAVDDARALGADIRHTHLTASAASWERPSLRGNLVRVGAFCYGVRSADGPEMPGIVPAGRLVATVSSVEDGRARIGIGALDGLPSVLAGRVDVGTPAGARRLLSIELGSSVVEAWPGAAAGDEVIVFGPGLAGESSATTLAETIGTVGEEILTRLATRVRRVHEPAL